MKRFIPLFMLTGLLFGQDKKDIIELTDGSIYQGEFVEVKNGNVRGVRFETLEKICIVLDCQPGDLLEYQSYTDEKNDKNRKDIFEIISKNLMKLKNKET